MLSDYPFLSCSFFGNLFQQISDVTQAFEDAQNQKEKDDRHN
jgi:hypothetical protein